MVALTTLTPDARETLNGHLARVASRSHGTPRCRRNHLRTWLIAPIAGLGGASGRLPAGWERGPGVERPAVHGVGAQFGVDESVLLQALPQWQRRQPRARRRLGRGSVQQFAEAIREFLAKDVAVVRQVAGDRSALPAPWIPRSTLLNGQLSTDDRCRSGGVPGADDR